MSKKQHNLLFIFVISLLIASMPISVSAIDINCYKITTALTPILTQSSYTIPSSISISSPSTVQTSQLSIVIDWPSYGQVVTAPTIVVSGTASSNVALNKVEVKVGSGTWQLASGTTSWSTTVNLASGTTTIYARVTDTSGSFRESSVIVTYSTASYSLSSGTSSGISSGSGKTYYVAKNGNDANPGTETQPWLTIQKAANTLVAGDTVYIKTGTYYERVVPAHSGTAGNYIAYAAYPGATVIVDGQDQVISTNLFHIDTKSYIIVQGIEVRNNVPGAGGDGWRRGHGVYVFKSHHIKILDVTTSRTGSSGIFASTYSTNTYLQGNEDLIIDGTTIKDANIYPATGSGYIFSWNEALDLVGVTNFVVRNTRILGGWKEKIDMKHDDAIYGGSNTGYGRIYGNYIDGTYITPPPSGFYETNGNVGIYQDGAHDVDIYNNVVINEPMGIAVATEGGRTDYNQKIYNNILYKNYYGIIVTSIDSAAGLKQNIGVYNNIAYGNTGVGIYIDSRNQISNVWVRNNIAYANTQGQVQVISGVVSDNNLVSQNPLFVDPANGNFHYQAGSPAIDTGSSVGAPAFDFDGNSRPRGAGYDIGAFEK